MHLRVFPYRSRNRGDVKIGRQEHRTSAISTSSHDTIVVRGRDLAGELIGNINFPDYFWLLLTGSVPSAAQRRVLDATLVAIAEHGLVPSVQAARMTMAAAPEAFQGAVAAGILGCGSVILGSSEVAGRFLVEVLAAAGEDDSALEALARGVVGRYREAQRAIPGYGHPLHKRRDPRVDALLRVAADAGLKGRHVLAAEAVERVLPAAIGKELRMNVSGAIPAVLLDAGFPVQGLKGVP